MDTGIVAAHVKIRARLKSISLLEAVYAIVKYELYWLESVDIAIVSGSCRKAEYQQRMSFCCWAAITALSR